MTEVQRLADLTDDGDTLPVTDDLTLRLNIEPDEGDIEDLFYGYGKLAEVRPDRYGDHPAERPAGFTGNAEKIWVRGDGWWWEPPAEGPKRSAPEFNQLRAVVGQIVEFGFYYVSLEALEDTDAYGRGIVRAAASLGGIEPVYDPEGLADTVAELAAELAGDLELSDGDRAAIEALLAPAPESAHA